MPAIFIGHSSRDKKISDDIKSALARLGFERVFLDFDKDSGFGAGEAWEKRLYEEVSRCHAIILVLTPNWLASTWCRVELAQARALGKVILPVICAPLGERYVLPEIQAVDLIDWNAGGLERIEQLVCGEHIHDNIAEGNVTYDLFDNTTSPACDTDIWHNNTSFTANRRRKYPPDRDIGRIVHRRRFRSPGVVRAIGSWIVRAGRTLSGTFDVLKNYTRRVIGCLENRDSVL